MTSKIDSLFNDVISTSGVNTQSNEMGWTLQYSWPILRRNPWIWLIVFRIYRKTSIIIVDGPVSVHVAHFQDTNIGVTALLVLLGISFLVFCFLLFQGPQIIIHIMLQNITLIQDGTDLYLPLMNFTSLYGPTLKCIFSLWLPALHPIFSTRNTAKSTELLGHGTL
jgi:hypothetical protein